MNIQSFGSPSPSHLALKGRQALYEISQSFNENEKAQKAFKNYHDGITAFSIQRNFAYQNSDYRYNSTTHQFEEQPLLPKYNSITSEKHHVVHLIGKLSKQLFPDDKDKEEAAREFLEYRCYKKTHNSIEIFKSDTRWDEFRSLTKFVRKLEQGALISNEKQQENRDYKGSPACKIDQLEKQRESVLGKLEEVQDFFNSPLSKEIVEKAKAVIQLLQPLKFPDNKRKEQASERLQKCARKLSKDFKANFRQYIPTLFVNPYRIPFEPSDTTNLSNCFSNDNEKVINEAIKEFIEFLKPWHVNIKKEESLDAQVKQIEAELRGLQTKEIEEEKPVMQATGPLLDAKDKGKEIIREKESEEDEALVPVQLNIRSTDSPDVVAKNTEDYLKKLKDIVHPPQVNESKPSTVKACWNAFKWFLGAIFVNPFLYVWRMFR